MLKLWGRNTSINVQKVLWVLGELDLAYDRIDVGGAFGGLDQPAFLALNPNGLIPVLEDGDAHIWESHAIIRYLAAKYDAGGLWPEDPADRAQADQWMEWHVTTLYPDFIATFLGLVRTPPSQRNMASIELAAKRAGWHYEKLEEHLEGRDFICGDSLTMGDIPLGATLYRYFTLEIERPDLPNIEAWYARLQERAAYRDGVMISYEGLRATEG